MQCPKCKSEKVKKNGQTHYGKQNYQCRLCERQFVENGEAWFISDEDKALINKLLLERISLSGICRVCNVSERWLLSYIQELYSNLPENLNAKQEIPNMESYLSDRMDEEIYKIMELKKTLLWLKNKQKQQKKS